MAKIFAILIGSIQRYRRMFVCLNVISHMVYYGILSKQNENEVQYVNL